MDRPIHRYSVIGLDVWGHGPDEHKDYDCDGECDGYTVNNAWRIGEIEVLADRHDYNVGSPHAFTSYFASDETIVKALVEAGYLTPDCTPVDIEIDGENDYGLSVDRKKDGKPLLQLERIPQGG
jgi:hypothetical protein